MIKTVEQKGGTSCFKGRNNPNEIILNKPEYQIKMTIKNTMQIVILFPVSSI